MHSELENDTTVFEKLLLTEADYIRGKINSTEISFKGKMYDVKAIKKINGKVELLVLNDEDEEHILKVINKLIFADNPAGRKMPAELFFLISLIYLPPFAVAVVSTSILLYKNFESKVPRFFSFSPPTWYPPPRVKMFF